MAKKARGDKDSNNDDAESAATDGDISGHSDVEPEKQSGSQGNRDIWYRGFFMLVFAILFNFAQTLLVIAAIIQFISLLITKRPNQVVTDFGDQLSTWFQRVAKFQTTVTDEKPFPWSKWGDTPDTAGGESNS